MTPDATGIVGTWANSVGARLVFRADGTFAATGDPAHPHLFATIGDPDGGDDLGFTKQPD